MAKGSQALQLSQQEKSDGALETEGETLGRSIVDPAISAGLAIQAYRNHIPGSGDVNASIDEVKRITAAVKSGDLSDIEGMLVAQAVALQTISANYLNRAQAQTAQRNLEVFFAMGLKAQSQSRATLQALVDLKFPRQTVIAKNVGNVNNGQQQYNAAGGAHGGKEDPAQIKQIGGIDGEWMDTRAPSAPVGAHPHLAAVGEVDRPQDGARKSRRVA